MPRFDGGAAALWTRPIGKMRATPSSCGAESHRQPYGSRERLRYDLFQAVDKDAPLIVYIHGGYWQRGDRKDYSFVARELNANGISVAIPSYSLCPAVSVTEIGDEIQLCLAALWKQTKKRPTVIGYSAGGHLAAEMLARDWSRFAGVPADLVRAGYSSSHPELLGRECIMWCTEISRFDPYRSKLVLH